MCRVTPRFCEPVHSSFFCPYAADGEVLDCGVLVIFRRPGQSSALEDSLQAARRVGQVSTSGGFGNDGSYQQSASQCDAEFR